jgi:hypothetical protein
VTVVTRVDYRPIGTGGMGPVGAQLRKLFMHIVRGNNPRYAHWNEAV